MRFTLLALVVGIAVTGCDSVLLRNYCMESVEPARKRYLLNNSEKSGPIGTETSENSESPQTYDRIHGGIQ